jgi:hypothetical protein
MQQPKDKNSIRPFEPKFPDNQLAALLPPKDKLTYYLTERAQQLTILLVLSILKTASYYSPYNMGAL